MKQPEPTMTPASTEEAVARSGLYRLLARIWLREPDRALVEVLCAVPLRDAFLAAGGVVPAADDSEIAQLSLDYCRLFIGPSGHFPPYQSVFQHGRFQSATNASMKRFAELVGYDTSALPPGLMLDHLGVQLDVMGHIFEHCSAAKRKEEELASVFELAQSFYERHLTWPANLLRSAAAHAQTEFYRSAVTITAAYLDGESEAFGAHRSG